MNPESFQRLKQGAVSCPLDLAVIRVEGPDARDFLHGQCTSHLKRLGSLEAARTAWCTPQGRVSFLFWLVPTTAGGYHLVLPASEAARCVQRLRMFVLRAEVEIEDVSATLKVHGLAVPTEGTLTGLPAEARGIMRLASGPTLVRMGVAARFLLLGPATDTRAWLDAQGVAQVDPDVWRYLDIRDGYVEIAGPMADAFLPQQLNLDFADTLAFDKGCYPGQEIIARLKYRGEVKSRLLIGTGDAEYNAGEKLAAAPHAPTGGQVLTAVRDPAGLSHVLAVADLGALDGALVTAEPPARTLHFQRPPVWQD